MKKTLLIGSTLGLLSVSSGAFACSQDELTKKSTDLQAAMTAYMQKNPDKAQEMSAKSQQISAKMQDAKNLDDVCKAYDELLASMK